jgi:hypothetical protein
MNTHNLLKAMLDIAPKADIRGYLNGVRISRGGTQEVTIEATDGLTALRVVLTSPGATHFAVEQHTDVILCRASVARALRLFARGEPPLISASEDLALLSSPSPGVPEVAVSVLVGRFPDLGRELGRRTPSNRTSEEQGVSTALIANVSKAVGRIVDFAVFSAHEGRGFKLFKSTAEGTVTAICQPCRL